MNGEVERREEGEEGCWPESAQRGSTFNYKSRDNTINNIIHRAPLPCTSPALQVTDTLLIQILPADDLQNINFTNLFHDLTLLGQPIVPGANGSVTWAAALLDAIGNKKIERVAWSRCSKSEIL